jgi:hypothetical protein
LEQRIRTTEPEQRRKGESMNYSKCLNVTVGLLLSTIVLNGCGDANKRGEKNEPAVEQTQSNQNEVNRGGATSSASSSSSSAGTPITLNIKNIYVLHDDAVITNISNLDTEPNILKINLQTQRYQRNGTTYDCALPTEISERIKAQFARSTVCEFGPVDASTMCSTVVVSPKIILDNFEQNPVLIGSGKDTCHHIDLCDKSTYELVTMGNLGQEINQMACEF